MRKKLSLFLVMLMALTMVLGTGITAMAAEPPEGAPLSVRPCTQQTTGVLWYVTRIEGDNVYVLIYNIDGSYIGSAQASAGAFLDSISVGRVYHSIAGGRYCLCGDNLPLDPGSNGAGSSQAHTHNYQYQVLKAPSVDADGEEAEVCTICDDIRNRQPISAMGYALYDYAVPMINASKPGQTITFEFKEWNSFPRAFMEKIAAKSAEGVTFVFHYNWNHVKQEITIPAGTEVSLEFAWNGPAKMEELYGLN